MGWSVFTVDSFTQAAFAGNPAAVCLLPERDWPSDGWMQAVAAEMNLSETAFVKPRAGGTYDLRWCTPAKEVDLCGHATLAAAHILWEQGVLPRSRAAEFDTLSGRLTCTRALDGITMDFPAEPAKPVPAPPGVLEALGAPASSDVLRNRLDYTVVLKDEAAVRALKPLARAPPLQDPVRGFIVTARSSDPDADYVCRYFAPAYGIDEDPVTGSIQCALGPYWAQELGKARLRCHQVSRRGGRMVVEPKGKRVLLTGQAVTTMRGELLK